MVREREVLGLKLGCLKPDQAILLSAQVNFWSVEETHSMTKTSQFRSAIGYESFGSCVERENLSEPIAMSQAIVFYRNYDVTQAMY